MLYVFAILGLFLAAGGIIAVVMCVRAIQEDDPNKYPLLFRSYFELNKGFAGIGAAFGVGIALLGGWLVYKSLTGG